MLENTIYNENCIDTMSRMDDESIDLVVTSPPYDEVRSYGDTLEWGSDQWKRVIDELFRVIVRGGVVVWIVNDMTINGGKTCTSFKQALHFLDVGFILHDTMIYKKSGVPTPGTGRYHPVFEYMFIFSKGKPKAFCPIKDRINTVRSVGPSSQRLTDGSMIKKKHKRKYERLGMRNNIWLYSPGFVSKAHPAVFPDQLAYDHIISWSNVDDVVYDPFIGSGTTAIAALSAGRKFIGSELNTDYFNGAQQRVKLWPASFVKRTLANKEDGQLDLF